MNKFLILLILLLLALNIYQLRDGKSRVNQKPAQLEALTDKVKYYQDKQGRVVAEKKLFSGSVSQLGQFQGILTLNQRKLNNEARDVPKGSLKAAVQIRETIVVPNLIAARIDSSTYAYSDSLVSFTATLKDTTLVLDSLGMFNEKAVTLLRNKQGNVLTVTNSNPYFKSADIDGILIPDRKKWHNSKAFKTALFLSGMAAGIFIFR